MMNYIVLVRLMQKSGFKTSNVKFWNRAGSGGARTTKPCERPKIQVCHPHERGSIDFSCRGLTYDILDSEKLHPRDIRPDTPSLSSRNVRKPAQKAANPGFQRIFDFQSPIS